MAFRAAIREQPDALTANGDVAFSGNAVGSHLLRLFTVARNAKGRMDSEIEERILSTCPLAWKENPLLFTKMVFYKRDCRGGAGEKAIGHILFTWLWDNHNEVARKNFHLIPEYGYYKDYLQILNRTKNHNLLGAVADVFASDLLKTRAILDQGDWELPDEGAGAGAGPAAVSLGVKWAPSIGKSHDKKHKICRAIASKMGLPPRAWQKPYRGLLSDGRERVRVVEKMMSAGQWDRIDLSNIPSVALNTYMKKCFPTRVPEKVKKYLAAVEEGKVKVKVAQLMPHEIVSKYVTTCHLSANSLDRFAEEQWKAYVEETRKLGSFERSLVCSDVSGSMSGVPMQVSIAMGILISTLAKDPWNGMMLTFSEEPRFYEFAGAGSLLTKVRQIFASGSVGLSTDVVKMFQLILKTGVSKGLSQEEMPERLYIISDMQFNQADKGGYMGSFGVVNASFKEHGYQLPEIVFINVNGSNETFPVRYDEQRVCMLSGNSPSVLKPLLKGRIVDPYTMMVESLNQERYEQVSL